LAISASDFILAFCDKNRLGGPETLEEFSLNIANATSAHEPKAYREAM
jgi:hypothetical protein